ncbi:MAG: hypothetical protein HIU93_05910 [Acidobacteria bacterium]|nr:hypothetical protein [Acidobacteriota bacterium]MBW4044987.1 hypothetical protein [Acidobacteriota bacterium]
MYKKFLVLTALLLTLAAAHAQSPRRQLVFDKPAPLIVDKAVPSGSMLVLDMNVGDVKVVRNSDEHAIRLEIKPHHFDDEDTMSSWVREFDVAGDRATIRLKMPKGHDNNSHGGDVTIYVPRETSLKLDLGVGDLTVAEVEGSKDLHVGIGDLVVKIEDASQYGEVEGVTRIGDISDQLWQMHASGFLGKTEHHSQTGRYRLRASVGIGDVSFVKPKAL